MAEEWSRVGEYEGKFYRFDRAGNLVERRDGERHLHLVWDANQRLIECRANDANIRYGYDPLGRRLFKETEDGRTLFYWDGDALMGESVVTLDRSKKPKHKLENNVVALVERRGELREIMPANFREYIYYPQTFEPLALVAAAGDSLHVYGYHNDPNGCPIRLTDLRGEVQWEASYSAYGEIVNLRVAAIENLVGLQGQYSDLETGLIYNRFRYFDPEIGQYVSQDPLGLEAGVGIYGFAPNTSGWIDPLGLTCQARLRGRTIQVDRPGSGWQNLVTIPAGATRRRLHPVPGGATRGFEYKWNDGTQTWRVRIHDADPSAPVGSNAHSGWIVRVQRGSQYADDMGTFHPPGIQNPNSPFHNPTAINDTHMPFVERQRFPR